MLRTAITIDHIRFFLAQGTDPELLRAEMVEAVRSGGDFVRFTEVGNRAVSVLVSPGVGIIFQESEVADDERDTGDLSAPFLAPDEAQRSYVDIDVVP